MNKQHPQFALIVSLFFGIVLIQEAQAYLDPGTGSFILQMLVAGFLGLLLTIKTFWYNIKDFFAKIFGKKSESNHDES